MIGITILPLARANAQLASVFEGQDASVETSVLPVAVHPIESAMTSFGNASGVVLSFLAQPAIFPQENDNVSWGNADAMIHSTLQTPSFGPPVNFEEFLAAKFKPILYLHQDEKYKPQEIQVVLDTAKLYKGNDLVLGAPSPLTPEFLSDKTESDYKLDLDGDTFFPGPEDNPYKNTTYAHITQDQGQIVLQYWFFYYYNDWIGGPDHEGDWEFVQSIFPQGKTVPEIIDQNLNPDQVVYSAHFGGYKTNWNTVEKENNRPVVYVAKGSHANHFQQGICDVTLPTGVGSDIGTVAQKLEILDLKAVIDSTLGGPFIETTPEKWLLFGGRWGGDNVPNFKESPRGPFQQTDRWSAPISWTNSNAIGWGNFYDDKCDGDFDGIWNNVDTFPDVLSNDFSAPGPFGKETKGTITERGDREFKIKDAAVGGAYIQISVGDQTAIVQKDCFPRSTIVARPGRSVTVLATCLSAEFIIEEGTADFITSHNGIDVVATVSAGQTIHYDVVDDKLRIETSGVGEIPLTINGETFTVQAGETFSVHEVQIDIKPGSDPNTLNCKSKKDSVIPVAILTTGDFDAMTVDDTTVLFEGAAETHVNKKTGTVQRHEEDVDSDGDIDLLFHFRQNQTTLTCDSTETILIGKTFEGDLIIGTDSIDTKTK